MALDPNEVLPQTSSHLHFCKNLQKFPNLELTTFKEVNSCQMKLENVCLLRLTKVMTSGMEACPEDVPLASTCPIYLFNL